MENPMQVGHQYPWWVQQGGVKISDCTDGLGTGEG
jgi:hypothetical protein